jgi:HEPN domain-containing protein
MITGDLRTPVGFIVHSLDQVNAGLAQGRYFFMDIARDGIALYQSEPNGLAEPRPKTLAEALALAQEYLDEWWPSASGQLDTARYVLDQGRLKEAAFQLHQAAERFYHCVLLVHTFYTPHSHNLGVLRAQAERIDPQLAEVWPRDAKRDRAMFEKLKEAYVKARYSRHYSIDEDELSWLGDRVAELGRVVEMICARRIEALSR